MSEEQEQPPNGGKEEEGKDLFQRSFPAVIVVIVAGLLAVVAYAIQASEPPAVISIIAFGVTLAGASLLVGVLIGLLFGVPRRLQQEGESVSAEHPGAGENHALYGGNTNLEQISDWLTKILVGVGLTQINQIGTLFDYIGKHGAKGFGGFESSGVFSVVVVIFFAVNGFLLGYLWTRLYLGRALTDAERARSLKRKLSRFEEQTQADALALQMTQKQLSGEETELPSQANLDAAVEAASSETRSQIFYRAQTQRYRNWREPSTKPIMERTIPVFRALIKSDTSNAFHANHGQLGYALKDQRNPDWAEAETELSRAIAIRGDAKGDLRGYEFNRAICRVMQDPALEKEERSAETVRAAIVADLKTAIEDEWIVDWAKNDRVITKWLKQNELSLDDLK